MADLKREAEAFVNGPDNGSADVLEALLKAAKAEAWDEGYKQGCLDTGHECEGSGPPPRDYQNPNPYEEG